MALVTGALGSVIPKLALLLKEEYDLQKGVRKKIRRLSRDLESMYAALRKVAEVPPEQLDDEVKLWARDVRELSYDVEDILDTFLVRVDGCEATHRNRFKRAAMKIGELFSKSKARRQIGGMIKSIDEQAEAVAERHRRYRAEDVVSKPAAPRTIDPRLEAMYTEVTQLIGIEKPSDELISKLSPHQSDGESKMKMKMVSVVGAGGLGKTTLAKAVYDKLKVDFQCTAFVPVGRDPDLKKVFRDTLIGLHKEKYMHRKFTGLDERQLIDEIREFLQNKRYFIVIDDIWKTDTWTRIKHALVRNNNGSRLITTTRHCDVADKADEVYKLEPLPRDQSEKLFYTRIFGAKGTCPNNELKEVSDKILNKCHDVPLAIITMASLLVGKTPREWIEVSNSIVFRDEKKNQQVSDTEWILSLSYYDLPAHLKSCLLYLSAYPEDSLIEKDPLIWKWVAEGFVDKKPGTSLFEVGEGYFNELINRSMIQAVDSKEVNGIVHGCLVHDMVLDLLRVKSHEENFLTISSTNVEGTSSLCRVRRLSLQNRMLEKIHQDTTHVRTLFAGFIDEGLSFQSFRLLRVLDLYVGQQSQLSEVHVENLLHLRHIRLRTSHGRLVRYELPEGIGALKFLQTLDVEWVAITELPSSVGLLTQLTCLRAGGAKLPNGIIAKLTSLEELQICVEEHRTGQFVKDLGNLRELRVLNLEASSLGVSEAIVQSDLAEPLGNLHKLQHLELRSNSLLDANEAIWDAAVLPRPLRHFIVPDIWFLALPSCINPSDFPNLTHLELFVHDMDERSLRILDGLPQLRHLMLWMASTVTTSIHATEDGCFQKLISLSLPISTVQFVLNEDSSVMFTMWHPDGNDVVFGSEKGDECAARAPAVMPNLRLLDFSVYVKGFIDSNGSCGRLGLEYLPSLQKVRVTFLRDGACAEDVERAEAALRHAIEVHPMRPTLQLW